jgi:hypothetical protein
VIAFKQNFKKSIVGLLVIRNVLTGSNIKIVTCHEKCIVLIQLSVM